MLDKNNRVFNHRNRLDECSEQCVCELTNKKNPDPQLREQYIVKTNLKKSCICICKPISLNEMGWLTGLEPATPGTTNQCSNQLSYSHHKL